MKASSRPAKIIYGEKLGLKIYHVPKYRRYLKGYDEKPQSFHPFQTIMNYVEERMSLEQAIDELVLPIENAHDEDEVTFVFLIATWQTFSNIVEQIPCNHDAHLRLAKLLAAIRSRKGDRLIDHEGELWQDLPLYQPSSHGDFETPTNFIEMLNNRGFYNGRDRPDNLGGEDRICMRYTNQCAFLARLIHLPDAPQSCEVFALLALSGALEMNINPRGLDLNVPGAAVWISYAGEYLLRCEREWPNPRSSVEAFRVSKATFMWPAEKKKGYCRERWDLWRDSFAWIADMEGVAAETRDIAIRAADEMVRLEEDLEQGQD